MKKIPYTVPLLPPLDEYAKSLQDVWDNRYLTNHGPKLNAFEGALGDYLGVGADRVACFVNGHLALECALASLELSGEVVTTPFTFISTIQALLNQGLTPVFADVDPVSFNIDPAKVEAAITPRTSAILPVHVFGRPCDDEALRAIAGRHGLKLLYDGAHGFGVRAGGRALADRGDVTMLSFHATKVFNTIEGGALVLGAGMDKARLRSHANFGMSGADTVCHGTNAKMNEFQAAMGLLNLRYVEAEIDRRLAVAARYNERLGRLPGITVPPAAVHGERHNGSYYPILVDEAAHGEDADRLYQRLLEHDIIGRRYFYPACNETTLLRRLFPGAPATPIAHDIAARVVTLPLHSRVSDADVDAICDLIAG